jgi:hypothetical protein
MSKLDLATFKRAIEGNDADLMAAMFATDASMRIIDSIHPPSHPLELHGKKKIGEFYRDICGRGVTHHLKDTVSGDGHFAFTEECEYPNGSKVFVSGMLDLDTKGHITRETLVQAWDGDEQKVVPVA